MPRAEYLRKVRSRWRVSEGEGSVGRFLAMLNNDRLDLDSRDPNPISAALRASLDAVAAVAPVYVFDPGRFESHARVRAEALRCAEGLIAAARQRMSPTERPLVSTAALRELAETDRLEGEPHEACWGRRRIAGECAALIEFVFQHPDVAAFRLLKRCRKNTCQRWLLALDDARRRYCGPNCWPSNQPHARTVRSLKLRRRIRAFRCNG